MIDAPAPHWRGRESKGKSGTVGGRRERVARPEKTIKDVVDIFDKLSQ